MSDLTLSEAAAELAKLGKFGRAIAKATEASQTLLGLQQNENEKRVLLTELTRQCEAKKAELDAAHTAVAEATAAAGKIVADAETAAERIKDDARSAANAARGAAQEQQAAAEAEVRRLNELASQIATATGDAKAALADLNAKIAAAKDHARTLMGA